MPGRRQSTIHHDAEWAWLRRTLLVAVALVAQVVTVYAHGGLVQLHQAADPFVVTVFTAPTPLHAGPVEVSVLVQDRGDRQPVLDGEVYVWLRREDGRTVGGLATRAVAQHQRLYSTVVHVPEAGQWELEVTVTHGQDSARVRGQVSAALPRPSVLSYWRSLSLPPIITMLFAVHQWLQRRAARRGKVKRHDATAFNMPRRRLSRPVGTTSAAAAPRSAASPRGWCFKRG